MCICIHVYVRVFYICDICTHFIYADFILLFYLWLLGQRWPNKEVQTNKQYWFIIIIISGRWHAPESNFTRSAHGRDPWRVQIYTFKIITTSSEVIMQNQRTLVSLSNNVTKIVSRMICYWEITNDNDKYPRTFHSKSKIIHVVTHRTKCKFI